jgi:hypothetical protein
LKKARAALREPKKPVRKGQNQAIVPATPPKTATVENFTLRIAGDGCSPIDLNELLTSLSAQVASGQAQVVLVVVNGGIRA